MLNFVRSGHHDDEVFVAEATRARAEAADSESESPARAARESFRLGDISTLRQYSFDFAERV
jgi:hypothetical protein